MSRREEILRATSEASKVLSEYPVGNRTSFDIVGVVMDLGIPLLFRPLSNLLGAVVAFDGGVRGIMVTTQRDLHVQRFTLAHELGHVLLGHTFSFDETIDLAGRNASRSRPTEEVAADTFAAELLGPRTLLLDAAKRHKWNRQALREPDNIYQLSLRLGISFQATCWALVTANVLDRAEARKIKDSAVAELKRSLAQNVRISDSWANVWALNKADTGTFLEAGPNDLFAVHVQDNATAGYLWRLVDAGEHGEVVDEQETSSAELRYGENSSRVIYLRFSAPGVHRVTFEHVRPWSGSGLETIEVDIDGHGKELEGLSRRKKSQALRRVA